MPTVNRGDSMVDRGVADGLPHVTFFNFLALVWGPSESEFPPNFLRSSITSINDLNTTLS